MSKFYILANLKMNKSFDQSVIYLESLSKKVTNYDDEIILFPSNISCRKQSSAETRYCQRTTAHRTMLCMAGSHISCQA